MGGNFTQVLTALLATERQPQRDVSLMRAAVRRLQAGRQIVHHHPVPMCADLGATEGDPVHFRRRMDKEDSTCRVVSAVDEPAVGGAGGLEKGLRDGGVAMDGAGKFGIANLSCHHVHDLLD